MKSVLKRCAKKYYGLKPQQIALMVLIKTVQIFIITGSNILNF